MRAIPGEAAVLDGLRALAGRRSIGGGDIRAILPGLSGAAANLIARAWPEGGPEVILGWTDEDWLAQRNVGAARLAEIRRVWPSPSTVQASTMAGWREHADMLAGRP